MAKKTNPKLVGVFVIGAIALVIAGILAFGGSQYFTPKVKFVAFFPSASLSGLDVGSPVTFHGVKVGQVTSSHPIRCRPSKASSPYSIRPRSCKVAIR
jgi:paraquat-inducible protein B